ncbi:hypothetical protein AMS64_01470 [Aeromonas veronii]|uniref:AlbA family DNA-binding domain-containing protein n=1 Tax=Aeromonas veronii TaxID=654 RepID=UPI00078BE813|nr:ATP-binding protein [Aeromonas veronii]AMQ41155.1 hypothetical protein AMS64_01470 [Aeromonas veronii]
MEVSFNINDVNDHIVKCIEKGASAVEVINKIYINNTFLGKESVLWDYKSELVADDVSLSKTICQIACFHNSYGGYLIYGVQETVKDKKFSPVKCDLSKINTAQIRSLIEYYLDTPIDFTFSTTTISYDGDEFDIGVIYIPKRGINNRIPVRFIRDAKKDRKNRDSKPVFLDNEVHFRRLDTCIKAETPQDWQFLFSDRVLNQFKSNRISISVEHNLPDKKMICADFFGRKDILNMLWEWFSDPFEYTKILAGDGGKGKTSIAYKFCQEFIECPPVGFERVVWLSAKEKQFSGIENNYFDLRQIDFYDYSSFLKALSDFCAIDTDEISSTSAHNIKKKLRMALPIFPGLIIVDNIDSLAHNDQLQVVDACRQLGKDENRFLITTRNRFSYSEDACIEISGLERSDYEDFLNANATKYGLPVPKKKQIDSIYIATDGSPLLTQSILRLCKLGDNFDVAVSDWKGQAGEDARNAALQREIQGLTFDAKRVILCIFYFDSCSKSELQQACGLGKTKLNDALQELQSLFLVNAPRFIDNEDRFSISTTTKLIVDSIQDNLATDYSKLKKEIQRSRSGLNASGKKGNVKRIGFAISQALALMKEKREVEAITTITNELKRQPNNPDLLLAHARCIIQSAKPDYETARKILKSSYDNGQDKEMLFDFWYNCEGYLGSIAGEIEVSKLAISKNKFKECKWLYYLAKSLVIRSSLRSGLDKINDLMEASLYLSQAIKDPQNRNRDEQKLESNEIHNIIWRLLTSDVSISWAQSFDHVMNIIEHGDRRTNMYMNAHECIVKAEVDAKTIRAKMHIVKLKEKFNKAVELRGNMNGVLRELIFDIPVVYS